MGENGKPRKVSHDASIDDRRAVFGELVETIDELIGGRAEDIRNSVDIRGAEYVERRQEALRRLWTISNRREPTTKYMDDNTGLRRLIEEPTSLFHHMRL